MDNLNINQILGREELSNEISTILQTIEGSGSDLTTRRGIYLSGQPGSGKTKFVVQLLKEKGYDVVQYDAGDMRNKSVIETLTRDNMSNHNVISMFSKRAKPIAVVMDEIDGMNSGDKGGINSLIKVIRPKKTKKQKKEEFTMNPIICISNFHVDKKIKELMRVCHTFELKKPTDSQVRVMVDKCMPTIAPTLAENIVDLVQGDLRKLRFIIEVHDKHYNMLRKDVISCALKRKSYSEDTRNIIKSLFNNDYEMDKHSLVMNDTDRTIVGLLWHENIIDPLAKLPKEEGISFYMKALRSMCYADFIDRVTFQKQIWQFNEMSSLTKTFSNNHLYHTSFKKTPKFNPAEVRFTKVLTKYSTEYNNTTFVQYLCQQLGLDSKDMCSTFLHLRNTMSEEAIQEMLDPYSISKLDISRLYRYLDRYTAVESISTDEDEP